MPNQTPQIVEQRIVAFSLGHPGLGPRRVTAQLAHPEWGGLIVSPNGVWKVLRRPAGSSIARPPTPHHPREVLAPALARFHIPGYTGYARHPDAHITITTPTRARTGRITASRTPADIVHGAHKMEPR